VLLVDIEGWGEFVVLVDVAGVVSLVGITGTDKPDGVLMMVIFDGCLMTVGTGVKMMEVKMMEEEFVGVTVDGVEAGGVERGGDTLSIRFTNSSGPPDKK
jgi:hypothetical protein